MELLFSLLADPVNWIALASLIAMEIVLGIDNLIFIAILTNKLPEHQRESARRIGLAAALVMRLLLLGSIAYIVKMTTPVLSIAGLSLSWRDIILISGGLFLVWKATKEIHHRVDPDHGPDLFEGTGRSTAFAAVIGQILVLDIVFSIDSIITAVGMTPHVPIMFVAVIITVLTMMLAATPLANFVNANPTIVMLALGFLMMIGTVLIAEGFGAHIPKGYIYAAMAFSTLVEGLNMMARKANRRRQAEAGASMDSKRA
jgi:predicted tellurium resistance membrane protein TerC